jgi:hypothetical protein
MEAVKLARRRVASGPLAASLALLLGGLASAAGALGALANPDFNLDHGIDGWFTDPAYGSATWAPLDANGCASGPFVPSGSLRTTSSTTPLLLEIGVANCVNLTGGSIRPLFFEIRAAPSIQQEYGFTISLKPYAQPNCQGSGYPVVYVDDVEIGPATANGFSAVRARHDFNGFVFSARLVLLEVQGSEWQGGGTIHWDRAYLGTAEPVFQDDLEAQSTCRWSATSSP